VENGRRQVPLREHDFLYASTGIRWFFADADFIEDGQCAATAGGEGGAPRKWLQALPDELARAAELDHWASDAPAPRDAYAWLAEAATKQQPHSKYVRKQARVDKAATVILSRSSLRSTGNHHKRSQN
jgi:hypothetical protein